MGLGFSANRCQMGFLDRYGYVLCVFLLVVFEAGSYLSIFLPFAFKLVNFQRKLLQLSWSLKKNTIFGIYSLVVAVLAVPLILYAYIKSIVTDPGYVSESIVAS